MDKSQREFLIPAGVYRRSYTPNGKALAVALLSGAVGVTYQRARKDLRPETKVSVVECFETLCGVSERRLEVIYV